MLDKNRDVYADHAAEASKPISERSAVIKGRNGDLVPRRHHLKAEEQEALLKEIATAGRFKSPYKRYGAYDGAVEALSRMGENESHLVGQVLEEFQNVMSDDASKNKTGKTAWERFESKPARSQKCALDHMGRFTQNLQILQRMGGDHPYGLKLAQLGGCIDILQGEKGQQLIRLRTGIPRGDEVKPINEFKKRKVLKSRESYPSGVIFQ